MTDHAQFNTATLCELVQWRNSVEYDRSVRQKSFAEFHCSLAQSLTPRLVETSPFVRQNVKTYREVLLGLNLLFTSGLVASGGGVRGPFWLLYVPTILFAAVSMKLSGSIALGALTATAMLVASYFGKKPMSSCSKR